MTFQISSGSVFMQNGSVGPNWINLYQSQSDTQSLLDSDGLVPAPRTGPEINSFAGKTGPQASLDYDIQHLLQLDGHQVSGTSLTHLDAAHLQTLNNLLIQGTEAWNSAEMNGGYDVGHAYQAFDTALVGFMQTNAGWHIV